MERRRKRDSGRDGVRQVTVPELEASLEMLRRQGVKSFVDVAGGGFTVEFFPAPTEVRLEPAPKDEDVCRCGHAGYEHGPLCLHGCDPLKCSPEDK